MSIKKVVPLYIAKSMNDLNVKAKMKLENDPKLVLRSISKLFKSAEECREEGDEEKSFILYMRYYDSVMYIRNSPVAKDKKYISSMINSKEMKSSIEWAEKLSISLEKRYNLLKTEEDIEKKLQKLSLQNDKKTDEPVGINNNVDINKTMLNSAVKPETNSANTNLDKATTNSSNNPTVNNINVDAKLNYHESNGLKKEAGIIECSDLYNILISKNISFVIMDTRNSEDFASSRMTSTACINIPAEIIKAGITPPKLRASLPFESKELWDQRGKVDYVILLDWSSCKETQSTEIKSLKDAIYKWDTITKLKNEPVVLIGGYDKWLNHYPTLTTNSRVTRPKMDDSVNPSLINLDFDYPSEELDKAFILSSDNDISSQESSTTSLGNGAKQNSIQKIMPNIDRTNKPKNNLPKTPQQVIPEPISVPASTNVSSQNPKPELKWDNFPSSKSNPIPTINRNLKPMIGDNSNSDANTEVANVRLEMWENIAKYDQYTNEALRLEKDRFEKEKELQELKQRREKEDESKWLELEKQESELRRTIQSMKESQQKQEVDYKEVLESNEILKKKLEEITKHSDEEFKRLKEELARTQKKDSERRLLENQRHTLEGNMSDLRKENIITSHKPEQIKAKNIINAEKSSGVERNPLKSIDNFENQNGVTKNAHFVKLKDSGSSGNLNRTGKLSRAHSFHNISQISDSDENLSSSSSFKDSSQRIMPRIDRKNKPSPTELSGTLNRNFMPVFGGMGAALTGLRNLGNTCYMNSVLQCLANTVPLVEYFQSGDYRSHINRRGKFKGILVDEFAAIIQALYLGQYKSISPRDFRNVISQYNRAFESCEQQDPQEFLNCVIDNLHEDLNRSKSNQSSDNARLIESLEDSALPDNIIASKSWELYKMNHNSVIMEMFQGQLRSTLKCLHCNKKAVKFDTFMFLSLPIPSGVNRCTLKDCLQLFLKEEKLSGTSKWKCPKCNEKRDAVMKIDIWKLPPVLLIHFKRFYYEGLWKGKMQTTIDFPVSEGLDLQSFVKGNDSKNIFNLYGVTNHSGTLDGGHCIAYCKNALNNRWFKYDDQDVRDLFESDVKSPGAYILYYITRGETSARLI